MTENGDEIRVLRPAFLSGLVTNTNEGPTGIVRIEAPDGTVLNVGLTPEQVRQVAAMFMNMMDELDALG
jgi:hypothetical protein